MPVANAFLSALLGVVSEILTLYVWVLIVGAVISWLVAFGVINPYSRIVQTLGDFITRITEPALRPIRRIVPVVGGLDLSPLVLIFIIYFLQLFIANLRLHYG
ncbi:MAG: YggT family protein [Alphaproteobacteria bacterium]|nr:YggT family protein [Alphaproteobacteria bacterium]